MTTDIVIASAASTPVGSLNGVFANVPAHDLGAETIKAVFAHAKVTAEVLAAQAIQGDNAIKVTRDAVLKLAHTLTQNYATLVSGIPMGLTEGMKAQKK